MNTKYTLEMLLSRKKKGQNTWIDRPKTCKSIREAKRIIDEDLQPKRATIKNKRGEPIHEYSEGEGWTRVNISKRNHCMLITVGYNWKTRKPITVPYSQC